MSLPLASGGSGDDLISTTGEMPSTPTAIHTG